MNVLRWWFTLHYDAIRTTDDRLAFEIRGPGVRVQSENELLTERGERIHTGTSDELTARFAASFTGHFPELARKYPVFAELRNVFDLALVVSLCEEQGLYDQAQWRAAGMVDPNQVRLPAMAAPREVDSVVNHRIAGGKYILVGVSGGVSVNPSTLVRTDAMEVENYAQARQNHRPPPRDIAGAAWWWDK
jgi:hypothetical protein